MKYANFVAMLLACDSVQYNQEANAMRLGHVINAIDVPVFPYACKMTFYVKILAMPTDHTLDFAIQVVDPMDVMVVRTPYRAVYNRRSDDQIPGVDTGENVLLVASVPGIHWARMLIDNEVVCEIPITIRKSKEETLLWEEPLDQTGS